MAIGVLNLFDIAIENSENNKMLMKKVPFFEFNCLEIAFAGSNSVFMSHPFIQNILDKIWRGNISNMDDFIGIIKVNIFSKIVLPKFVFLKLTKST